MVNLKPLFLFLYNLYLVAWLTGCMAIQAPSIAPGDALTLSSGAVKAGIQTALAEAPAVARLISPDKTTVLVSWPLAGHQAWSFVTDAGVGLERFIGSQMSGQIANVKDWNTVRQLAEALGWTSVTGAQAAEWMASLGGRVALIYKPSPILALTLLIAPFIELNPYHWILPRVDA